MSSTDTFKIEVPTAGGVCKVWLTAGTEAGRSQIYVTAKALGEMLAQIPEREEQEQPWQDFLGSHGIATARKKGMLQVVLTYPEMERVIQWTGITGGTPREYRVLYPPCTFLLGWQNDRSLTSTYLWTSHRRPMRMDDDVMLQAFPWGNVYSGNGQADTGKICWGALTVNQMPPSDPQAVVNAFFKSTFNHHIWGVQLLSRPTSGGIPIPIAFPQWVEQNPGAMLPLAEDKIRHTLRGWVSISK